jgi:hypothetical protein
VSIGQLEQDDVVECIEEATDMATATIAQGVSVIERLSPHNVLKDAYDHICY